MIRLNQEVNKKNLYQIITKADYLALLELFVRLVTLV